MTLKGGRGVNSRIDEEDGFDLEGEPDKGYYYDNSVTVRSVQSKGSK